MAQVAMYPLKAGGKETTTTADITASDTTLHLTDLTSIPSAPNLITIKTSSVLWERCRYTARVVTSGVAGYITIERSGAWHASSASGNAALAWGTGSKVLRAVSESDFTAIQGNISDHETRIVSNETGVSNSASHIANTSNPHSVTQSQICAEPGRNYIINPAFEVNQRGYASVNTSGSFPVDRWKLLLSGSACVASQQAFTLGQTDVPGEPKNYLRAVVTSSAGSGNYVRVTHLIEGVRTLAGKTANLTFYAKADSTKHIGVELVQNFGTTGSPSADVTGIGAVAKTLTNGMAKYAVDVTIPSISGKTLGTAGNDYLAVNFWLDAGSTYASRASSIGQQSGTFDIANVKLEEGSVATPCIIPRFDEESLKCQRYMQVISSADSTYTYFLFCYFTSTTRALGLGNLKNKMRSIPTLSFSTASTFAVNGLALTSINAYRIASDSIGLEAIIASGGVAGQSTILTSNNTIFAYIFVDAEL